MAFSFSDSFGDHVGATQQERSSLDSLLEQDGLELAVPPRRKGYGEIATTNSVPVSIKAAASVAPLLQSRISTSLTDVTRFCLLGGSRAQFE
jgi:hypothetical protein